LGVLDPLINGITGLLSSLLDPLVEGLVGPITAALNELILQQLISELGTALLGDTDKAGLVEHLGVLLNPWNNLAAKKAVVTVNDYPKSIDFDLAAKDFYPDDTKLLCGFSTNNVSQVRTIALKTFAGSYQITKIDVDGQGLVAGLVINEVLDDISGFLLTGALVDVEDSLAINGSVANKRYGSSYDLLSLATEATTDAEQKMLTIPLQLGNVANIDGILGDILSPLLGGVLGLLAGPVLDLLEALPIAGEIIGNIRGIPNDIGVGIKGLTVTVQLPLNLSLLDIQNLSVDGSWSVATELPAETN
jgi:hypothetical protein